MSDMTHKLSGVVLDITRSMIRLEEDLKDAVSIAEGYSDGSLRDAAIISDLENALEYVNEHIIPTIGHVEELL